MIASNFCPLTAGVSPPCDPTDLTDPTDLNLVMW